MPAINTRVGAILSSGDGVVNFLGWGTYVGDEVPEESVGGFGALLRMAEVANPCIQLDSGKKVWGCECWWGDEAEIKQYLDNAVAEGWKIEEIDIDEARTPDED